MRTYQAILFDFDGTLADSYAAITASVNHTLTYYGRANLSEAAVRAMVGHGLLQLMEEILPDVPPQAAADVYRQHHPDVMISHTRILPGVAEGLAQLSAAGVKMGICSNKPSTFTREILVGIGLAAHFQIVLGPNDVAHAKPAPDMIHAALAHLDTTIADALYVGDMQVDIETGRRANVETWVMPTGSCTVEQLEQANAQKILPNFEAVMRALGYTT